MKENAVKTPELSQWVGPAACVKCGTAEGLSRLWFEKTYTPKWAYVGLLFCWNGYHKAKIISNLMALPCLVLFIAGPIFWLAYKSLFVGLGCVAVAIAIAIFIDQYIKSASPKCVSLNRKSIVLAIPRHGEFDLAQATS
jgi:hypothetical protein